jgi:hypothetical protein
MSSHVPNIVRLFNSHQVEINIHKKERGSTMSFPKEKSCFLYQKSELTWSDFFVGARLVFLSKHLTGPIFTPAGYPPGKLT